MAQPDPPDFRLLPDDSFDADAVVEPETGRALSLRSRIAASALILALAVSGVLVQLHRTGQRRPAAIAAAESELTPWPSGRDVCGNTVNQPVVKADPPTASSGLELSIGANSLFFGSLDSGETNPEILLIGDTFLFDRVEAGGVSFVELADCAAGNRIEEVTGSGQYRTVLDDPLSNGLLTDGTGGVWAARFTDGGATISEAKLQVILRRLDRPSEIPLGSLMFPLALHGHLLYAEQQVALGAGSHLVVYDLLKRRVVHDLGPFDSAEAKDGLLVWVPARCDGVALCNVRTIELRTGTGMTSASVLPKGFRVNAAAISPDHRRLAVPVARGRIDPKYTAAGGSPPSDVLVLELRSVAHAIVPGVEIPPGGHIALAFAPDSRRLVLGVGAGGETDFYLWIAGQTRPRQTRLQLPTPLPSPAYLRVLG